MSLLPRWGYEDWRDVRNDLVLLWVISKVLTVGYLVFDWVRFGLYGYSYVMGYAIKYLGWDSPVTEFIRWFWMLGRGWFR